MNKLTAIITLSFLSLITILALNFTTYEQTNTYTLTPENIVKVNLNDREVNINGKVVNAEDPNSALFLWKNTNLTQFTVKEEVNIFNKVKYTIVSSDITKVNLSTIINEYSN
jgi:hypothetical protein